MFGLFNRIEALGKTSAIRECTTPNFYDNLPTAKGKLTKVSSSVSTTEYTSFDILGRVTAHKQTTDGQSYSTAYVYNVSGALVEQTYPSGQTFTYDRYGNRNFDEANTTTLPKECTESENPVVCEAIRPIVNPSVNTANNRLNGYTFDASGNTTHDADGRTFIYDAENKQVEVLDNQQNVIGQYRYDGDGKRVKKVVPATGEVTVFVYDAAGKLVAEYSTVTAPPSEAKVSYLTNDHLGSPRINTDQNGSVTARHDYHPFGEEIAGTGGRTQGLGYTADEIRKQFTGYERDNETNLDYAQARYYKSNMARFTSPDPIIISDAQVSKPQGWNLYAYVGNNPLAFTDPTGMERVRLGQHTDEEIEKRLKSINEEIDRIGKIKDKTIEQKEEQDKLKAERKTLGIEKEGNKIVGALLKSLESKGELDGLKLSDFTVTTDSANDFKDEPRIARDPGKVAAAFVLNGYSREIFINTRSSDYALYKAGDADAILYGGTAARHEKVHRDNYPKGDSSEKAAYTEQLRILQKYGPGAFKSKEFYNMVIDHVTKGTKKTN